MKHKTILKQALLFKDGAEPIYSKIQKLYEAIIQYQELHTTSIISAKPKQRAKLLNQELLFEFLNELIENKRVKTFDELEHYLSPSSSRIESIEKQGDSKSHYAKVFNQTLLFKKRNNIAQLYNSDNIQALQNIEHFVVIENAESFLNIETNSHFFSYQYFIYLGGQANCLTRAFLKAKKLLFFVDFDIVSMNIYEDFDCQEKELFTPHDLENYFKKKSNQRLYKKQREYLREAYNSQSNKVIELIKRYSSVVEQEVIV